MANGNHEFCRLSLQVSRAQAKTEGVTVPRLSVYKGSGYYHVQDKANGDTLCMESAHCRYDAKARTIDKLIESKVEQ